MGRITNVKIRKLKPSESPTYYTQKHRWLLCFDLDGRKQIPTGFKTKAKAESWLKWLKQKQKY